MSNNNSTELLAWAREVCALRTELARPIEVVSDPRLRALKELWPSMSGDDWKPEHLGVFYFEQIGVKQLPACPLPAPAWGLERGMRAGEWPDVEITDRGAVWESGASSARLERETSILVDVLPDNWNQGPDGEPLGGEPDTRLPGDTHEATYVRVIADTSEGPTFYVAVDRAHELVTVIGDALHALHAVNVGE
jgi:hypothetical protein